MRALEQANEVRIARAALKRRVADGETDIASVILACPVEAHNMAISDLLMSQRSWGASRCRKFLALLALPEDKSLGSLTERQRHMLVRDSRE